jgi:lysozyme
MQIRNRITLLGISSAVALIAGFEGFRELAYQPIEGDVATIGFGQTYYADGSKVQYGDKITKETALEQLTALTQRDFANKVNDCVKVPLSQNEYDAYVSLAYNIGSNAFCSSTLVKKLNQYDYVGACQQILRWNKSGGKVVKGLENRRLKEYKLCLWGEQA